MSISDRLDQIERETVEANEHLMLAALRAVLDLHKPEKFMDFEETCSGCDIGTLDPPTWPCATYRAIATALGEGQE